MGRCFLMLQREGLRRRTAQNADLFRCVTAHCFPSMIRLTETSILLHVVHPDS